MKTLLIPDIHENIDRLLKLDDRIEKADRVVCLGDYFDTFGPDRHKEMIRWLVARIEDKKYTFLLGNHDVSYFFDHQYFMCSGFKLHKRQPIRESLLNYVGETIKLETLVGPYCVTHAGWHPETLKYRNPKFIEEAFNLAKSGAWSPLWGAGLARGGASAFGGPVWLDWSYEFQDIPDLPQIVGHTPDFNVRYTGKSACIDTHLQKVVWYDDETDKLTVEYTEPALN